MCLESSRLQSQGHHNQSPGSGEREEGGEQASLEALFSLCPLSGFSGNKKEKIFLDSLAKHLIRGGNEKSLQKHSAFV